VAAPQCNPTQCRVALDCEQPFAAKFSEAWPLDRFGGSQRENLRACGSDVALLHEDAQGPRHASALVRLARLLRRRALLSHKGREEPGRSHGLRHASLARGSVGRDVRAHLDALIDLGRADEGRGHGGARKLVLRAKGVHREVAPKHAQPVPGRRRMHEPAAVPEEARGHGVQEQRPVARTEGGVLNEVREISGSCSAIISAGIFSISV